MTTAELEELVNLLDRFVWEELTADEEDCRRAATIVMNDARTFAQQKYRE